MRDFPLSSNICPIEKTMAQSSATILSTLISRIVAMLLPVSIFGERERARARRLRASIRSKNRRMA